jgi:hypothetical protein
MLSAASDILSGTAFSQFLDRTLSSSPIELALSNGREFRRMAKGCTFRSRVGPALGPFPAHSGLKERRKASQCKRERESDHQGHRPTMSWSWLWTFGHVPELPGSKLLAVVQAVSAGTSHALIIDVVRLSSTVDGAIEHACSCRGSMHAHPIPAMHLQRTESEWRAGHIQGSKNASFLPPWSWPAAVQPLIEGTAKDTEIYVICLSAHRSIGALKWLKERGRAWRCSSSVDATLAPHNLIP